jgi:hypothetical protein
MAKHGDALDYWKAGLACNTSNDLKLNYDHDHAQLLGEDE